MKVLGNQCFNHCSDQCILIQIPIDCQEMCSEQLACFLIRAIAMSLGVWRLVCLDINFQPLGREGVGFQLRYLSVQTGCLEIVRKRFDLLGFFVNPYWYWPLGTGICKVLSLKETQRGHKNNFKNYPLVLLLVIRCCLAEDEGVATDCTGLLVAVWGCLWGADIQTSVKTDQFWAKNIV